MSESAEQDAEAQAAFRDVNEATTTEKSDPAERVVVYCECADEACAEDIVLSVAEYERVRANGRRFIVLPGHVDLTIESVVATRHDRYWVVEKKGLAGEVAEETDPRS